MRSLIGVVIAAVLITGAGWLMFSLWKPSVYSYEECMLAEMKGQQQNMYGIVDRLCSRRWSREVSVATDKYENSWTFEKPIATIQVKSADYEVTRAKARFAPKLCKDTNVLDWSDYERVSFVNGKGYVFPDTKYMSKEDGKTCMQMTDVFGTYK